MTDIKVGRGFKWGPAGIGSESKTVQPFSSSSITTTTNNLDEGVANDKTRWDSKHLGRIEIQNNLNKLECWPMNNKYYLTKTDVRYFT